MKSKWISLLALFVALCAAAVARAQPADAIATRLAGMTIEEKVGQMMAFAFKPANYADDDAGFARHLRQVRAFGAGGLTFFRGDAVDVARCLAQLQGAAKIPLLVMSDIEFGLPMRVNQGTRFPLNMAVGATGEPSYAYQMGRIIAAEARAMGIHVGYCPVVDVNNNPDNIIINTRSFGEDPERVGRFGAQFVRGLQEHGVYATAKHYPGHGDTAVDSHLSLPVINASRQRLENVELAPFRAVVKAGVKCVMVGHITFSKVPEMRGRPASLDRYFIRKKLRREMGFDGLVITDAMRMGGITRHYGHGEAAVMAVEAGCDIILMPGDFGKAYGAIVTAVKKRRLSTARIDESVRRILAAKAAHGLLGPARPAPPSYASVLRAPDHVAMADTIADRAVTLVSDEHGVVPLAVENVDEMLAVIVTDEARGRTRGRSFVREVERRVATTESARIDPRTSTNEIEAIVKRAEAADAVLVGVFVRWRDSKGSIALPETTVERLKKLLRVKTPLVVIAFGSPYVLRQFPPAPASLCAYDTSSLAAGAAVRAVFGEVAIGGRLPVSIPGRYAIGTGLDRPARGATPKAGTPKTLVRALDDARFGKAYAALERSIADRVFPGAQIAIVHDGKLVASRGVGEVTYEADARPVTTDTIYDLASVTKVAATTVIAMVLADRGKIDLDTPVKKWLPRFKGGGKDEITLRHLLTHSAGLKPWAKLWRHVKTRKAAFAHIDRLPLVTPPGEKARYSDLGMIQVGRVLEKAGGRSLDRLAAELVYEPLGLKHTRFKPPAAWKPRIAPTEVGGDLDRGLIHGEVHDENTQFLGGVSAHAGLFSTAEDLAVLAQMLLNGGTCGQHRFFSTAILREFTRRQNIVAGSSRALGWDTPSARGSHAGDRFSKRSFGHTGFTGTSIWIDREKRIAIILLTNRVHPTRKRGGMKAARRAFYNAAMEALDGPSR